MRTSLKSIEMIEKKPAAPRIAAQLPIVVLTW